ncbi:addiction module protein [Nonlabens sp.]|uniref:addiction module protein n=1 Tax=Nonlabens sp. TaxID=1888209 RepID=UPI003F69B25E
MDLEARKYQFIQELFKIDKEQVMTALERVLKREKEEQEDITLAHKKELDHRLTAYKENPDNVLDWEDVKSDW